MTAQVLFFSPPHASPPQECLKAFVEVCRKSLVLDADSQFDKDVWHLGAIQRGKNIECRIIFSTLEAAKGCSRTPAMAEPFLSFAKAMLVYRQSKHAVISQAPRLSALRYLDRALRDCGKGGSPTAVDETVLDAAVDLARKSVGADLAYREAGQLQAIVELMRSKGFIRLRSRWLHGLPRPDALGSRISLEAIRGRQEKLPSSAAIGAMGGVFQVARGVADTIVASVQALLICAPERINEVMRLKRNCLVFGDGRFSGKVGIRWPGSKGAKDTTKWIPSAMVEVVKEAIKKLIDCTKEAHQIACWYAKHKTSIYLHEDALHLRGRVQLTYKDVALLLWGKSGSAASAKQWCRGACIKMLPRKSRRTFGYVRFADVEGAVIAMLPSSHPYLPGDTKVGISEALCVIRKNELHSNRARYLCAFDILEQGDVGARLGQRNNSGIPSLFAKYDFTENDGTQIHLKSHQPRHYLNMLGQVGGLSSAEIAIFSGRADERQNRAYDHMSSDEVQNPIKIATREHGFMNCLVEKAPRNLVNRAEFPSLGLAAAHSTNYGYCVHYFASEPCHFHADHINCDEHKCIKGELIKEANLKALQVETKYLLARAKKALSEEEFGADLWVIHQQQTLERINELLALMASPDVAIGASIQLTPDNVPVIGHTVSIDAKTVGKFRTRALK